MSNITFYEVASTILLFSMLVFMLRCIKSSEKSNWLIAAISISILFIIESIYFIKGIEEISKFSFFMTIVLTGMSWINYSLADD